MTEKKRFIIEGGKVLKGEIVPGGNKNAALPMIAASLLTNDTVILENVPKISDVDMMLTILEHLGGSITYRDKQIEICCQHVTRSEIPRNLCTALRTSFLFVAPLLIRTGRAKVFPPGGDVIGRRRLDSHFYGLATLGADVEERTLSFSLQGTFKGKELFFDEASVTATEHIMMAATLAEGKTIIRNAASEPHVQDVAFLLKKMGAKITGLNTNTLVIEGVKKLHGANHRIASDHIEVGSYLALGAATGGEITIHDTIKSHYWMIYRVFQRFDIQLEFKKNTIILPGNQQPIIRRDSGGAIPRVDDGPWPQFPSDLMSSMIVLATQAQGTVLFFEKMFESRMYFVDRLIQMGANAIVCDPHRVMVSGKTRLRAQRMSSPDIRAGMAMVISALCAEGCSEIDNASVIDRGYENTEKKLQSLGASIIAD